MHAGRGQTVVVQGKKGRSLERPTFWLQDSTKKIEFDSPRVRIGAGPGNDLRLQNPTISSSHLELFITEHGFKVRDLDSTNGTRVGGVRISEAFLDDGVTLHVGDHPLAFHISNEKVQQPLREEGDFCGAVGASPSMRALFSRAERVAKTNATVLINGETGTGKEVLAGAIWEASKRADKPFVVIDCGSIARNLIESELFGHEKGAFTGAVSRRIGAFERADGGTLFLDELGELELDLQPKLLRALERREVQRVGGHDVKKIDVRILAATNRDLRSMVARGEFREDLYYRLAVVALEVPSLKERREDIPKLVHHFLQTLGAEENELPDGAMQRFAEQDWPGNCRELKNAVERAVVLGELRLSPLLGAVTSSSSTPSSSNNVVEGDASFDQGSFSVSTQTPYKQQKIDVIADFEERYVRKLMAEFKGNVSAAARTAGIDRMSLHKIITRYGLDARELGKQPS
ncbi:MAG: FHA domain-containing protein [Deltaproteobacteria bacterium]|nr:FHA domain-containing protein [Deltaproteobacteria bacterium]